MYRKSNLSFALIMFSLLALPLIATAEHKIVQASHQDAFTMAGQTQPESNDTTITWLAKSRARIDQGDTASILIHAESKMMFSLDHAKKEYVEIPLSGIDSVMLAALTDDSEGDAEAAAMMMQQMKAMMKMDVTVTPTTETQKIRDWNCKKYLVDVNMAMGKTHGEAWATEDLQLDWELYAAISHSMMAQLPDYEKILTEMKKVKGLWVKSVTTVDVMGTSLTRIDEVVSVTEAAAPAGLFEIPKDYKKMPFEGPMGGGN